MTTAHRVMTMDQSRLMELLAPSAPRNCSPSNYVHLFPFVSKSQELQGDLQQLCMEQDASSQLLRQFPCTYDQLYGKLLETCFDEEDPSTTLPPELCKNVMSFLCVKPVEPDMVRATSCSSHDGIHDLGASLVDSESSWWLSRPGSMPSGRGQQWVQYTLDGQKGNMKRVSSVSIKIPPMPQGPLSVRQFCLQTFSFERGWHAVTPTFTVKNKTGWQKFDFDGVDLEEVRLVCLSNQMAEYLTNLRASNPTDQQLLAQLNRFESVGFFATRFE